MNKDVMGVQEVSPGYEFVAENPAVPVGYKQTEVGVIPGGWDVSTISDLASVTSGATPPRSLGERYFQRGTIPWVKTLDLNNSVIKTTDEAVTEHALRETSIRLNPAGTVLVAMYGGYAQIGRTGYLMYPATTNQALSAIIPESKKLDSKYLLYVLNYRVEHWKSVASSSRKDPNITGNDVRAFTLPLPPVVEQRAIATALIDVDALLEELDRLIAKKRDIKQAAMQQLLTGETRLPGFEGEWEQVELGEVTDRCTSGATPYRGRPDFYKGNIRWISSGELNYGVINDTNEHISLEAVRSANLTIHPAGIFLMAITGLEAAGTRGACGIVGKPSATNQSCMAIYPTKKLDTMYLFHYYVFRGDALAFKYCQGTKQQSYTAGLVKKLPISLPPSVEEQRAIAAVLSDMDTEIQALEQRRSKTAELKQGMMQELLTGRTRLV